MAGPAITISADPRCVARPRGALVPGCKWDRSHRYCGRCGTPTRDKPDERAKRDIRPPAATCPTRASLPR